MSFDKLIASNVSKKQEEITFKVGDEKITFFANELTVTQRIQLGAVNQNGGDTFLHWVVLSITDEHGKRMSLAQAALLPDDVMERLIEAVLKVNPTSEKEVKKKGKPRKSK